MAGPEPQLPLPVRGFDDANDRDLYHYRTLQPLASNNPLCLYCPTQWSPFPQMKVVFPYQDAVASGFASVYESDIHPAILYILGTSSVMPNFRELHLIRMGFGDSDSPNPLVLLTVFEHNSISVEIAKQIVSDIADKVNAFWNGEQVYIDACQRIHQGQRNTTIDATDLTKDYKFLYDSYPLPGSSIGSIEHKYYTGTLCGYITHDTDVFALTNHHIVNANGLDRDILGSNNPYKYIPGQKKHFVVSPSNLDHEETIHSLKTYRSRTQNCNWGESDAKKRIIEDLDTCIHQAENYHRNLGYVYATSGNIRPAAGEHRQDWALIYCGSRSECSFQNKHRRVDLNWTRFWGWAEERQAVSDCNVEEEWLRQTYVKFCGSPIFGSIGKPLEPDEPHYLKSPSARSGFRLSVCNGIRSTLNDGPCGLTREWAFISPQAGEKVAELGDSGSSILDKDHNVAALVWGGDSYTAVGDLTFATPFRAVIQDIETRMGWERGSCVWISS